MLKRYYGKSFNLLVQESASFWSVGSSTIGLFGPYWSFTVGLIHETCWRRMARKEEEYKGSRGEKETF